MIQIQWAGPPAWWQSGRVNGGPILYIVMHDTEGNSGATAAEAGIAYDKTRPDSVSTHIFVDSEGAALREVEDADTAFACFPIGNQHGISIEMCHVGAWNLNNGVDAATFDHAAQVAAQLCKVHAIPARKLTQAQLQALNVKGICGHRDITEAYNQGDHTDPDFSGGIPTGFPWNTFISRVQTYLGGSSPGEETTMVRYVFGDSWGAARPSDLGTHPVVTDALGAYYMEPFSLPTGGRPAAVTIEKSNDPGAASGNPWGFDRLFAELTGGCTWNGKSGLAPWREVSSVDPGELTDHQHSTAAGTTGGVVSG